LVRPQGFVGIAGEDCFVEQAPKRRPVVLAELGDVRIVL